MFDRLDLFPHRGKMTKSSRRKTIWYHLSKRLWNYWPKSICSIKIIISSKYHPIRDPKYFRNRDFIGKHWNRKFIRAVQAVLNATKGKIGRGKSFFEEAFGKDEDGYFDILWIPETFIIERMKHKENLTREWHDAFHALTGVCWIKIETFYCLFLMVSSYWENTFCANMSFFADMQGSFLYLRM